ncbi:uncharacterized protein L3040_009513 [Drepanopeziza brunnea f. sp. 'multigermtubi']|uniref:uncharacterized protein n=1 Tax=Drepanopeziza brunnea f. sp. 'multigermtubi' TaxID=698441 RepID=UPI002384C093|nr:hypothetical protein L3040_009513 [Drepanopeziza brunnea f. sp. 'multigermtubi']
MAAAAGRMPPLRKDPTIAACTRMTSTGRKLTYELKVIQQPERARACGSGAKSSADRRPVDPPPVVELRIYEGDGIGDARHDITFGYGANFFLFATLEVARPMAHGRVQQTSAPQVPVLTGMPVSGMAYLDRPKEAGYFIFPDLSVRHEGRYILSFNLYEETKDAKDRDADPKGSKGEADPSFDWRLEIKSDMFTVFSAKKFPGLAESTSLSRTVAEQGCRVRIRRDVRMRRRDDKGGNNDGESQDDEYARTARTARAAEQEAFARSRSNSMEGRQPIAPYHDAPRSRSHSPADPQAIRPAGGYLGGFDHHQNGASQFAAPAPHPAPPPPPPQHPAYPPQPAYHQQGPLQHDPRYPAHHPPPGQHYGYERNPSAPTYGAEPYRDREMVEQPGFRRASEASQPHYPPAPYPQPSAHYHGIDSFQSRPPSRAYAPPTPSPAITRLPPLRNLNEKPDGFHASPAPLSALNHFSQPPPSPRSDRLPSYSLYPPPPVPLVPAIAASPAPAEPLHAGSKRSYDSTFSSSAITQPLHNGMRPGSSHGEAAFDDDDDEEDEEMNRPKMTYKRADGSDFIRSLPSQD